MIGYLSLSKNVQFYKLNKALTKKSIADTFKDVSKERVGNYLLNESKKTIQLLLATQLSTLLCHIKLRRSLHS